MHSNHAFIGLVYVLEILQQCSDMSVGPGVMLDASLSLVSVKKINKKYVKYTYNNNIRSFQAPPEGKQCNCMR